MGVREKLEMVREQGRIVFRGPFRLPPPPFEVKKYTNIECEKNMVIFEHF